MTAESAARVPLEDLRRRIAAIEAHGGVTYGPAVTVALGDPTLDDGLPWHGLPRRAVHELRGPAGPVTGFAAALAARLLEPGTVVVWCAPRRNGLYGPGLAGFGLAHERLILVERDAVADRLWAAEEALRCTGVAAVIVEADGVALRASRRLQLAAETARATALLLVPERAASGPSAAATRWRIAPAPAERPDLAVWDAELWRCKCGAPKNWRVAFDATTLRFAVAAARRA